MVYIRQSSHIQSCKDTHSGNVHGEAKTGNECHSIGMQLLQDSQKKRKLDTHQEYWDENTNKLTRNTNAILSDFQTNELRSNLQIKCMELKLKLVSNKLQTEKEMKNHEVGVKNQKIKELTLQLEKEKLDANTYKEQSERHLEQFREEMLKNQGNLERSLQEIYLRDQELGRLKTKPLEQIHHSSLPPVLQPAQDSFYALQDMQMYSVAHPTIELLTCTPVVYFEDIPLPCGTCGKVFTTKGSLASHVLLYHGGKNVGGQLYSCVICGISYNTKNAMNIHKSRYHKTGEMSGPM